MNKRIVLIGFACSYKTSVGKKLAKRLQLPHYDTDTMIENTSDMTIKEIFDIKGEAAFRQLESQVIDKVPASDCVVSCGGGTVMNSANMSKLTHNSVVIWLSVDSETALYRVQYSNQIRPLQDDLELARIDEMLSQRNLLYSHYADLTIDSNNHSSSEIVDIIVDQLNKM